MAASSDTTDMIVVPLLDGGELRICAVHGRVEILARIGKSRVFATTPISADRGEYVGTRISEISKIARAQKRQRECA